MYTGPIIDTHMHLWDLANGYAWLSAPNPGFERLIGNYDAIRHNFLPSDYAALTRGHDVVKSVHVQAFGFPDNPVAETAWLQAQADRHGYPHGIVAYANLSDPKLAEILEQHRQYPNVRGIRMPLNWDDADWRRMTDRADYMRDAAWRAGFAQLARHGMSFDVQIYDHQAADVADLASAFPETALVVEHLAWPITVDGAAAFEQWAGRLSTMAECPNVSLKLTGAGCVLRRGGADADLVRQYLRRAIEIFGPQRCMFGSNCPPDSLYCDFGALVQACADAVSDLTPTQQRAIFHDNAQRIYRL